MKSYIEPLSAAEVLDVLDLYGVDTPGAFPSTEHEGCVEVEMAGHTVLLETPDSVKMLIDNFIPAMKRCDVSGGGPTPGIEDAPEGATVRATRPGDINISFPALAERAQAAALATACGATTAAGNRL